MTIPNYYLIAAVAVLAVFILFILRLSRKRKNASLAKGQDQSTSPEAFAKGYELSRVIAVGGMGEIYEAFDPMLRRRVAIKRPALELRKDPMGRKLFLREARIVAALRHPNIVEIYAVVENGDDLYLVFEYIDGKTLDAVVIQKGHMSPEETLHALRQIAPALDYSHGSKIRHRDLKLSNIMIDGAGRVKVMDFGIARRAKQTLSQISQGVSGTTAYMSPEQHLGTEKEPADIYALGVCVYRMLTGTLPFIGIDYLKKKEREEYPKLTSVLPSLPPGVDAVMTRALHADPAKRHASAAEFLAEFEKAFQ